MNIRKPAIILLSIFLALAWSCGKSGSPPASGSGSPGAAAPAEKAPDGKAPSDKASQEARAKGERGQMPGGKPGAGAAPGDIMPVSIMEVPRKNLNSYLVLNGIVEPERLVEVYSRLAAYVKEIIKEEGDYVRENDVLALLDDTEIKISYEQSRIALDQAKVSMDEAEQNYIRSQELIKKDLISEQEFQTQEGVFKQRQLDYSNRQESLKNLELQLGWTKIRALAEGYITERLIEVGSRVTNNQQVYTIEDFKPLLIRVYVPTSDAVALKVGMPAEITTSEVLRGAVFTGNVKLINPRIDTQTGTVKVTVEAFDDTLRLKPGMFVEVRINIGHKENVLVVPRRSVLYKQNKTYVFAVTGNTVSQREVVLGLNEEDEVEVVSGIEEGQVIVLVGVDGLKDGQRIEILK